jgi:hypothetical protein
MQRLQLSCSAVQEKLQLARGDRHAAREQGVSTIDPDVVVAAVAECFFPPSTQECMRQSRDLLSIAVVPDPSLTPAEVLAANSAGSASGAKGLYVTYRCVLNAPDAAVQYTLGVVRMYEALLRGAAASCAAVAQMYADRGWAGAASAAAAQKLTLACVAAAELFLAWFGEAIARAVEHDVTTEFPHYPSAITLAALSAGPGSDLQRQLFSLLCTMVKLGRTPVPALVPKCAANASSVARGHMRLFAATK